MLHSLGLKSTKRKLLALCLSTAFLAGSALGQSHEEAYLGPNQTVGASLNAKELKRLEEFGRTITEQAMKGLQSEKAKEFGNVAKQMQRSVDAIADETLAEDRARVQRFLGINPEGAGTLYYFVSWSMPLPMLRAYALEAMWSGGTLIFKGVPAGKELAQFITKDLKELVYGKGAAASISIDPRLFDAYSINVVPAIVYSEERRNFECNGVSPKKFKYEGQTLSYSTCPKVAGSKFWKIAGSVTSNYALQAFIDSGASGAQVHLNALAKGLAVGETVPKIQRPYEGDWKDAISPEQIQAARSAVEEMASQQRGNATRP